MGKLSMSKAIRRQIYTSDLIFCTAVTFELSNEKLPRKTIRVLDRIKVRMDNINTILYGGTRDEFLSRVTRKDRTRYQKTVQKLKKLMNEVLAGDKAELDFFNAVLMLVEDTRESAQKSKNKRLRYEWVMLNQSFATLCNHIINEPETFDPDWIGYKYERLGVALGRRFERIIAA